MNAAGISHPLKSRFLIHHQNNPFDKLNFSLWYPEEKRKGGERDKDEVGKKRDTYESEKRKSY